MNQEELSQPLQMPNVFVVPPEEDQAPIWCCFNASQPTEEHNQNSEDFISEIQYLDPTSVYPDDGVPFFHRNSGAVDTVVMPRKSAGTRSIVEALLNNDDKDDQDSELDWDPEHDEHTHDIRWHNGQESPPRTLRDAAEDSDVIEVVKVSRGRRPSEGDQNLQPGPPPQAMKRSTTFKARASKAFRSLTGSLRSSKPRVQDLFPSRPSSRSSYRDEIEENCVEQAVSRSRSPPATVSRRKSAIFSQLFSPPSLKSRNSVSSFDDSPKQVVSSPLPDLDKRLAEPSVSSFTQTTTRSYASPSARCSSLYQDIQPQESYLRMPSPNPSTNGKSSKRRFSRLNLQKLFTFSSQIPQAQTTIRTPDLNSGRTTPTLNHQSSGPPSTSSESTTSGPQTPTSTEDVQPIRLVRTQRKVSFEGGRGSQLDFDDGFGLGLGLAIAIPQHQSQQRLHGQLGFHLPQSGSRLARGSALMKPLPTTLTSTLNECHIGDSGLDLDSNDLSLEMRLDSLHFDSLSFDADQFNI